jgi:hypothetical protein
MRHDRPAEVNKLIYVPIAKFLSFEYIAANLTSTDKSRHSTPNDAMMRLIAGGRTY